MDGTLYNCSTHPPMPPPPRIVSPKIMSGYQERSVDNITINRSVVLFNLFPTKG